MRYIDTLRDGEQIQEIYLCKSRQTALTKGGKPYENVVLQDKTGILDAKIWNPNDSGIREFDNLDYVEVTGNVTLFMGKIQLSIRSTRKVDEGEYDPSDYLPVSQRNVDEMYSELSELMNSIRNQYLNMLLHSFFDDKEFVKKFKFHSAAKSVHHGFVGGLLEHTLGVAKNCEFFAQHYPILNRDLLITAAIFHDIGKLKEISRFPENDYTDVGQLLGHIMIGAEWVGEHIRQIEGFPVILENELKHCILAHHGELEFGSPKKPALIEAVALSFADNIDAKMETVKEILEKTQEDDLEWQGYNRLLDSNFRRTSK